MSAPEISVIISHFKKPEMLRMCIRSVEKALHETSKAWEIIVADSMTIEKTITIMRSEFPDILFLPNPKNIGYSRSINKGIAKATGKYLLVLNADLITEKQAINTMLQYMEKHSDVGMLGPQLRYFNNDHQHSYFRFYTPMTILARRTPLSHLARFKYIEDNFLMRDTDSDRIQTPDWIMGSAMMLRRSLVDKIGGMDERFFMYFEDVDWCRRVWHNGYKVVYLPETIMHHYLSQASKSKLGIFDALLNRHTRWHIKSALAFFMKYRNLDRIPPYRRLQLQ